MLNMKPAAWEVWVGADTPLNKPMGWQRYSIYETQRQADVFARTVNSYKQAPFAKVVPLFTAEQMAEARRMERDQCVVALERLISGDGICADDGVWIHDCVEAIKALEVLK